MRDADDGGGGGEDHDKSDEIAESTAAGLRERPAARTAFAAMLTEPLSKASPERRRYADQLMAAAVAAGGSGEAFERVELKDPTTADSSAKDGAAETAQEDGVSEAKAAAEVPSTTSVRP